ncbi:hypothetical protein Clacol_004730 [Clathrus columnatus]|uniref:Wings apart-like protein C-terminal domain-containing protein n=1 Tax=Clathrus columnatus TaxID=1419009 RepID=A0AAV5ABA9_9AGAM|nr:hypothetical protein Clacol_004730 [Clathrus columnatus]
MSSSKRAIEDGLPSSSSSLKRHKTEPATPPPKDLSGIFAHVVSKSVVSTPSKSLTRRMLAKSSTEPAIITSPSKTVVLDSIGSRLGHSLSLPTIPSSPPSPRSPPPLPRLSPPPSSNRTKTNIRTYSQVRSFLMPLSFKRPQTNDKSESENEDNRSRESYSALRTRFGVDHSEDNPFHVSGLNNDLSTITELRSKGESRRFLDEMGYLFEGLEPGMAASVRRSSASEIVANMCDSEFMRKAKATDFTNHVWDAITINPPDKVLDFYIAFFIALVARDKRDMESLCRKSGFFEVMNRLLRYPKENDAFRVADTRPARSAFTKPELTATLISFALKQTPISVIPADLLSFAFQQLLHELHRLRADIDAYTSKKGVLTFTADLQHIRQCLTLLDSTLMTRPMEDSFRKTLNTVHAPLVSTLAVLYGAGRCSNIQFTTLHDCLETVLRTLMTLSNLHSSWATSIGKEPRLIRHIVHEICTIVELDVQTDNKTFNDSAIDRPCLSLALLSNLVLTTDKIKDLLRETQMNSQCPQDICCILECQCELRTSVLHTLTSLFINLRIKSESNDNMFFQAHLGAVLCLLTVENPMNHKLILQDLKKENALLCSNGLKESIQSFQNFYNSDSDNDTTSAIDIQMQEQIKEACRSLCS